jgi:hypothetical protein
MAGKRERRLRDFLIAVDTFGCRPEIPPSPRQYLNVAPPPGHGRGRLCSVTVRTGRLEFQQDTYSIAEAAEVAELFDLVPAGNKAGITLNTDSDVEAAVRLAKSVLGSRRGT